MIDRSSSRWRWLLIAATVALLGARLVAARCWVHRSVVTGGGGPPAVLVARNARHRVIEKWDWNAHRMEPIGTFEGGPIAGMLCTGDGKFVWFAKGTLHVVDLAPPHEPRQWKTTLPEGGDSDVFYLLGTSANSRFVVVEMQRAIGRTAGNTRESQLLVIDLHTGEEVSKQLWNSRMQGTPFPGEFTSFSFQGIGVTPQEPLQGEWRLTDEGAWELLPPGVGRNDLVNVAQDAAGNLRGVSKGELFLPGERDEGTAVSAVSPDREHVLRRQDNRRLLLAHEGRRDVQVLPTKISYFVNSSFTVDGEHLLVDNVFGDAQVFDAATGRMVASTQSGLIWHCVVSVLAATCLGIAVGWWSLAIRQTSPLWAIFDLHAAAIASQVGVFSLFLMFVRSSIASYWWLFFFTGIAPAATAALGIAVGWFWAYGRANFVIKLKWGFLSIVSISVVPAVAFVALEPPVLLVGLLPAFAGLFAASVTAFLLSPTGMLGWRASDEPLSFQARRFGLASMMLLIAGASVAIGFVNLLFSQPHQPPLLDFAMAFLPTSVIGLLLPGVVMMNVRRATRTALTFAVVGPVLVSMLARTIQREGYAFWRPWFWERDLSMYSFAVATGLLIFAMATLARKHGWRWRKAQAATSDVASLEASA